MDFYQSAENSFSSNCFKTVRLFANRSIAVTEPTNHIIFGKDIVQVNIELYTILELNCEKEVHAFMKWLKSGDTFEINQTS